MTRPPTVHQARRVCSETGARGVIVLALDDEGVAGASYGATKAECAQMGTLLDRIVDALESGKVRLPALGQAKEAQR